VRRTDMARYEHLPIFRAAFDLALHLEKIVKHFAPARPVAGCHTFSCRAACWCCAPAPSTA